MLISYERLKMLLNNKGESINSLFEKEVITNHSARLLRKGDYVNLEQIAKICIYFNVPIEQVVEVVQDKE